MSNLSGFFDFHRRTYVDTVRVNIITISQQNLKVQFSHVSVGWVGKFFPSINVLSIPRNLSSRRPGMYLAMPSSYLAVYISFLFFSTFSFVSLQLEADPPMSCKEKQCILKKPLLLISFCIII